MNFSEKKYLSVLTKEEISAFVEEKGFPRYRTDQIENWISVRHVTDPGKMTNLPKAMQEALSEEFLCSTVSVEQSLFSPDGAGKLLMGLRDGEKIECAVIPARDGRKTFCISTQVGCPVQCVFCSSGANGFTRNLEAGEITDQFFAACQQTGGELPDNLVVMGIGEPLLNCGNLIAALDRICDPDRTAFAARRVTISTSGWTPGIRQLTEHGRQWNLALSLHASDDRTRAKLIPTKFRRDIAEILRACDAHKQATERMLTLEYVLLAGVNDSMDQAEGLAALARRAHAKVNLIPYNKARGNFRRPAPEVIRRFENVLKNAGITVTVRVEKGSGSTAACGQLRASAGKKQEVEK